MIKRALLAFLIAEIAACLLVGPVVLIFWCLTSDATAHFFTAILGGAAWLLGAPALAFGPDLILDQLNAAHSEREADLAKLLKEHLP